MTIPAVLGNEPRIYIIRLHGRLTTETWTADTLTEAFSISYTVARAAGTGSDSGTLVLTCAVKARGCWEDEHVLATGTGRNMMAELRDEAVRLTGNVQARRSSGPIR